MIGRPRNETIPKLRQAWELVAYQLQVYGSCESPRKIRSKCKLANTAIQRNDPDLYWLIENFKGLNLMPVHTTELWQDRVNRLNLALDNLEKTGEPFRVGDLIKAVEPNLKTANWLYQATYAPACQALARAKALQEINGRKYARTTNNRKLSPPEPGAPDWVCKLYRLACYHGGYKRIAEVIGYSNCYLSQAVRGHITPNGFLCRGKGLQAAIESLPDIPSI